MFIIGLVLMFGGIAANVLRLFVEMPWNTKTVLLIGKTHKWFGRGVLIVTQFVIGSGAYNFYSYEGKADVGWAIAGTSAALFFIALIAGEVSHQLYLRKEVQLRRPVIGMNVDDFEKEVATGRKLVILDDLVLDVEKFID